MCNFVKIYEEVYFWIAKNIYYRMFLSKYQYVKVPDTWTVPNIPVTEWSSSDDEYEIV